MVSIMTALWFDVLAAPDRVSVKPHASPVLHAINYLLGDLDARLPDPAARVRRPAELPEPDQGPRPVDYSTGSVGIGATATIWGALAHRYLAGHVEVPVGGRQIALVGDAELDEGAFWEALVDPLDRPARRAAVDRRPQPPVARPRGAGDHRRPAADMFEAAGWHCSRSSTGGGSTSCSGARAARRCGAASTRCPTRSTSACCAPTPPSCASGCRATASSAPTSAAGRRLPDDVLLAALRDLGGHDHAALLEAYERAEAVTDRPSVVLAYTIKGWGLPTAGHPSNHSALLTAGSCRSWPRARRRRGGPVAPAAGGQRGGGAVHAGGERLRRDRRAGGPRRRRRSSWAARTRAASRPSRRSGACSSTSRTTRPR